jgi:Flp pilus assembly protein TadG
MEDLMKRRQRRGVSLVEAALVFPVLLLLLLGLLEYGWIFLCAQQITHAARHGARVAALADATADQAYQAIDTWMTEAGFASGSYTRVCTADVAPGQLVEVIVTGHGLSIMGSFVPSPDSYEAKFYMAKEGPNASPGP